MNGKRIATGGIPSIGVLSVTMTWVKRRPLRAPAHAKSHPDFAMEDWICDRTTVGLHGLDSKKGVHVTWSSREAGIGDEVTIRVLPPGSVDAPASRMRSDAGG